jgi:large subunit ribosomal protein L31
MKPDIHPETTECVINCVCGATYTSISTKPQMRVEVCSKCHPFYTGQQTIIDTAGRVESFRRRYGFEDNG